MAHGKKYLSTEVSVHKLELEFVDRYLEFEQALTELDYFLKTLPGSINPAAQAQRYKIYKAFHSAIQAARLAKPRR